MNKSEPFFNHLTSFQWISVVAGVSFALIIVALLLTRKDKRSILTERREPHASEYPESRRDKTDYIENPSSRGIGHDYGGMGRD